MDESGQFRPGQTWSDRFSTVAHDQSYELLTSYAPTVTCLESIVENCDAFTVVQVFEQLESEAEQGLVKFDFGAC